MWVDRVCECIGGEWVCGDECADPGVGGGVKVFPALGDGDEVDVWIGGG